MITDPALLERQLLDDEAFRASFLEMAANFPPREWTQESFERGLRYPWSRAPGSYLLREGETELLHGDALAQQLEAAGDRFPLLAFGSNAAPRNLAIKLAHHERAEDREVLVLSGELHDFDVVACAAVAIYGAMPATLAPSPGTRVGAAVLLVNATQLTTLTWGEIPYRLGRLRGAVFTAQEGLDADLGSPLAYVSRWGAFAPDGEPAALGAVTARERGFRAWTQRELLDRAAEIVLGADAGGAEALSRAIHAGMGDLVAPALTALSAYAQPFSWAGWEPIQPLSG